MLFQIHGGAWVIGDKSQQGLPLMLHLAADGWVCVAINYRLSPRATWPEHLVDCKRALAWVREHIAEYGGDPDFDRVTGGSAGGHLAAMVALTANEPRVPARLRGRRHVGQRRASRSTASTTSLETFRASGTNERGSRLDASSGSSDARSTSDPEFFRRVLAPSTTCSADAPPCFVIHGATTTSRPSTQARRFVGGLRAVSTSRSLYAELPGAIHAFDVFHSTRTGDLVTRSTASSRGSYSDLPGARPRPRSRHVESSRLCDDDRRIEPSSAGTGLSDRSDDHGAYGAISRPGSVTSGTS